MTSAVMKGINFTILFAAASLVWAGNEAGSSMLCVDNAKNYYFKMDAHPHTLKLGHTLKVLVKGEAFEILSVYVDYPGDNTIYLSGRETAISLTFPTAKFDNAEINIKTPKQTLKFQSTCTIE